MQMGKSCLYLQQKPSVAQSYFTRALELLDGMGDDEKLLLQHCYEVGEWMDGACNPDRNV